LLAHLFEKLPGLPEKNLKTTAKSTYLKYFKLVKNQEYLKKYQYNKFIFLYLLKPYGSFFIKRDQTVMHVYIVILVLFCFSHNTRSYPSHPTIFI